MPTAKETAFDADCSLHSVASTSLAALIDRTRLGLNPEMDSPAKSVASAPEATEAESHSTSYKPFNGLSPAEAERLAILAEEAGEIVRAVGKILRHGYTSYHPTKTDHSGNRAELESEIGDLIGTVRLMAGANDVNMSTVEHHAQNKIPRIMKYAHHQ